VEAAAILGGTYVQSAQEDAAHGLGGAEAAAGGDDGDGLAGVLQAPARGLDAHALDVAGGRDAGLGAEGAGEVARAHVGAGGHGLDGVIAGDVLEHGLLDLAQRLALGALGGERGAELGLVGGAAEDDLDEREREVHAGGDAGGGPDGLVAHVDRLRVDAHARVLALELVRGGPVGGGAAPVEQPGAGEQEGAGADGGGAPGGGGGAGDPVDERAVVDRVAVPGAAGDDQRVDRLGRAAEAGVRDDAEAAGGWQRPAVAAEHADLVAALAATGGFDQLLCAGEHLERARDVEALHAWVGDDRDVSGRGRGLHASIILPHESVCKDRFPTIPAIDFYYVGGRRRAACEGSTQGRTRAAASLYDGRVEESQIPEQEYEEHQYADDEGPDALSAAPGRVASIVSAAEQASLQLREQAEARARERIAEADRAADNRVQAAEDEAEELLSDARAQAQTTTSEAQAAAAELQGEAQRLRDEAAGTLEQVRAEAAQTLEQAYEQAERLLADARGESEQVWATAHQESERVRTAAREEHEQLRASAQEESERLLESSRKEIDRLTVQAREQNEALLASGREELARVTAEAEEQARATKAKARDEAREITSEAHVVAHDILSEGTEVSRNLRELSTSLRNNAERLIRDVRLTHGAMTARLDQVTTGDDRQPEEAPQARGRRRGAPPAPSDDLDVPEFIPRG
jgi:cell division septum initiation protein DivIVA